MPGTYDELRTAVQECRRCPLYANATQAVLGEGPLPAELMLVGEQPGDQEDKAGKPFVGPAGRLLDKALDEAGIRRDRAYLTNAVKHFKWKARGPRRIHDKPSWTEQVACRPWLEEELALAQPRVLVLLGATAAQTLLGRDFRITRSRGDVARLRPRGARARHDPPVRRAARRRPRRDVRRARAGPAPRGREPRRMNMRERTRALAILAGVRPAWIAGFRL